MKRKEIFFIPNLITFSRILLLIPAIYFLKIHYLLPASLILTWIFLSDFLDGYFARKLNQTSFIGAILDPIADKIVVLSLFTYFFLNNSVPNYYYIIILTRDIAQLMSVPVLLLWKKIAFQVKPKLIPKWGTALNFIILACIALPIFPFWQMIRFDFFANILFLLYFISSSIELYILITYIPRFIQIYKGKHDTFE